MKRVIIAFAVSILVLGSVGLWISASGPDISTIEMVQFGVILLLVAFGIYIGFSRLNSVHRGEPTEDELSKKVLQKASSISFYISLYLWVGMILVNDRLNIDTEVLLGTGILAMAVCWVVLVIIFRIRGLRDA